MPELSARTRRKALGALSRDTLASITAEQGLAVEDRRSQAVHVDAIVRSRSVDLAAETPAPAGPGPWPR